MKRMGVLFGAVIIMGAVVAGMWVYPSWRDEKRASSRLEMKNVYLIKDKGETIQICDGEETKECLVKEDMKDEEYRGIGDVTLEENQVQKLVKKPGKINGKVLAVESGAVEIQNYGTVPLDPLYGCFEVKEGVSGSSFENLYVGQTDVDFAVADGKICGVLFRGGEGGEETQQQGGDTIRVILKTDDFAGYEHESVTLRGTKKMMIQSGKEKKEYAAGEEVTVAPDSMNEKRITVTSEEGGKIEVASLKRDQGVPAYRGQIEVIKAEGGLHLINDLSLEEYLYGVIPSEMPAEYSAEALKAQAVCARSYAVIHRTNNRLKELGAQVDDSVSYQVYNNTAEDDRCNQAVDATKGKKVYYNGKIVSTYFFSTSCGVTTSAKDVMFSTEEIPCLTGHLQEAEMDSAEQKERARLVSDTFGNEDLFRKFLTEDRDVLDQSQPWYRWSTVLSCEDIENNINTKIGERCQADGEKIQVRQPDGSYQPEPITSIGKLKRIRIKTRKSGGVVSMAVIVGTEATVRVYSEYNIRLLVFHENAIIQKNDGKRVSGMSMLPSGFFVMDKKGDSYQIQGGGFGHGTGMSQTGANELAQRGKSCEEIIAYYFDGAEVSESE